MKPMRPNLLSIFCLVLGLFSLSSPGAHAGAPAPPKALKLPKLIDGDFTYTEYTKFEKPGNAIEDEEKISAELTFELLNWDPTGQMAFYRLDNAGFRAKGKVTFVIRSDDGCEETHISERTGGGLMDAMSSNPAGAPITHTLLIWMIKDKRFTLTFVSPLEKGQEIKTTRYTCPQTVSEPITLQYEWTIDLEGAVDFNARTNTYRFVLLDRYTVPYRENPELRSNVYVLGELKSKAGWGPAK